VISPHLDPLDEAKVRKVVELIERRAREIDSLKRRCLALAEDLGSESDLRLLQARIRQHIRAHAVLSLDKAAIHEVLDSVFSDERAWAGVATFLFSLIQDGPVLTACAAIYALSILGSKAVKVAATRRQKIEVNQYALLYRVRQ
jgi:hypothetical protein